MPIIMLSLASFIASILLDGQTGDRWNRICVAFKTLRDLSRTGFEQELGGRA